eukprot:3632612-Pyramimonas_sp.AAC.2
MGGGPLPMGGGCLRMALGVTPNPNWRPNGSLLGGSLADQRPRGQSERTFSDKGDVGRTCTKKTTPVGPALQALVGVARVRASSIQCQGKEMDLRWWVTPMSHLGGEPLDVLPVLVALLLDAQEVLAVRRR